MAVHAAVLCVLLDPGERSQALKGITSPISLPLGTTTLQGLCMEHCLIFCAAACSLTEFIVYPPVLGLTIKFANLVQGCR